jgi:predicted component of type VI protein secretion system
MSQYINIPLSLGEITRKKEMTRVDLNQSIHNMLHLILITGYNEVKHNPGFGNDIWEFDFDNITTYYFLKDDLSKSIRNSIITHERRLEDVSINLQIKQVELGTVVPNFKMKTEISIDISGVIKKTNETLRHRESFYIGPFSY